MAIVAVSGMAFEARIAAGAGARAVWRGSAETLANALADAAGDDCHGLLSFGVAGGLAPHLRSGTCVVASAILDQEAEFHTDLSWSQNLLAMIPDAVCGRIAGVSAPVAGREAKRLLHERTGAVAVDMESHIVAATAASRGLPVAAIRVITDSAADALPQAAIAAMRANGTIDIIALIRSLMHAPNEVPLLLRTARDAIICGVILRRSSRRAGIGFGLPVDDRPV